MSETIKIRGLANVTVTKRAKTVLIESHVWAGHRCAAYEGPIQTMRIVRPDYASAIAELGRRLRETAGGSSYVSFGGQFRHVAHLTLIEVSQVLDEIVEAVEDAEDAEVYAAAHGI